MDGISSPLPFRLAQTYGVAPAARREAKPNAAALVATKVAAGIDFQAPPQSPHAPLAMYRHPADKNAATTAVNAGRLIDVNA